MKLLEYEAKQLLSDSNIPVPSSVLISKNESPTLSFPVVLKSQVHTGGRGKAGGIKIVESAADVSQTIDTLFKLAIKELLPTHLLAEEKLIIKDELYISLMIDRRSQGLKLLASRHGGVEVEEQKDFKSWDVTYGDMDADTIGQQLADYFERPDQTFSLQDLIQNLYECFTKNDATLIEINPLVITDEGKLLAGDCKMTLDDAAGFRHDWIFEETPAESNFVTLNPQGTIATIANGAGLAMATVDAVEDSGLSVANFLDIGGGANTESLLKAFHRITEYTNLRAIVINIFAGITRADEVARAIIAAKKQITDLPPLYIRLAGTNYQVAEEILNKENIIIMPNLDACLRAVKEDIDV